MSGCCFEQKSIETSPTTWNVSVTASDSRYNSKSSIYYATLSFPSSFSLAADPAAGQTLNCQPPRISDTETGINTVACTLEDSDSFIASYILTSTANSNEIAAKFTALSVDETSCPNVPTCNRASTLNATDVMIGSQIYPKWAVALTAVAIAAVLLAVVSVTIKCCVNRQRTRVRILEMDTEYSDYSRRPTENSYFSSNEKAAASNEMYSDDHYALDMELGDDILRYRREFNKEAYDRLSDIDSSSSKMYNGKLPSITSFRRLHLLSSRTLLTSLPSLPSLPKLPSFNSMPFSLPNNSTSQNSLTDIEQFRPTADSSLLDESSETTVSVVGEATNTVNRKAAVEAHKVIRRASRKSKTRSTMFAEEHINKIFHLDEDAKHISLTELYPQYGNLRSKSTTTLGSGAAINTSCPNSVRVKHREPTMLEGMKASLIERSMSASNVMNTQSDGNESVYEEDVPFIILDPEEPRPKPRKRSNSLSQHFSPACDDFGVSKSKSAAFNGRSLDSYGRQRQSVCSVDAKRHSQSATPSAASTIRLRSFLLPQSVYYDDSSSDDNSDTITHAKFQRRYRSLTCSGSQKSGSTKRKSPTTSCTSNTSDVDTIRKHLQASWKAEMAESPSHDSLNVDAHVPFLPRKARRPALPEGFMRHRTDRFSRPASIIEPVPEPAPPNDLTSQDSLDTLSSFVPELGYTSEDTESIAYSNAASLAILRTDSISSGLSVLSIHKGKHETESSVCGLNETNSESNRSFHSQQSLSDLAVGDPIPSDVFFY